VNDITLLDSWNISAQGHFTNNTDLFPQKISKSFNGCPMKAVVRNDNWLLTTEYYYTDSNPRVPDSIGGVEFEILMIVLDQINMTFKHVPTPEEFQLDQGWTITLRKSLFKKEAYIAIGCVGTNFLEDLFIGSTSPHTIMSFHWYVPCSDKYPRWSSMFRILSVELWLVLIISVVVVAISTKIVARYSCTSEWQVYKTLSSSLTNIWSVILGVSVSAMPRSPSLRSLFLAWVCFCIAFTTVFQAFLTTFLVDPGYKKPIENMDELLASGLFLEFPPKFDFNFMNDDIVRINSQRQPDFDVTMTVALDWAIHHKNLSLFVQDFRVETMISIGELVSENSEPLLCKLEDGTVYYDSISMVMVHGDPLLRRVSEIIDRVVEAGLYNFLISLKLNEAKLQTRKIGLVHPLDGYYSFKMYHMQTAFYLLLMGWCISSLCFMIEILYNRFISKRK
jgi:hypothetical protein